MTKQPNSQRYYSHVLMVSCHVTVIGGWTVGTKTRGAVGFNLCILTRYRNSFDYQLKEYILIHSNCSLSHTTAFGM